MDGVGVARRQIWRAIVMLYRRKGKLKEEGGGVLQMMSA